MQYWKKLTPGQIRQRVFEALGQNVDYRERLPLGLPASHLDEKVFTPQPALLQDAPFLATLVQNPNHIGCHTLGDSESFFAGTQAIERELIALCAADILRGGDAAAFDGYVAAGGTEANIQALWIYRNYYQREHEAENREIGILCSADAHYSMHKAADLLGLRRVPVAVTEAERLVEPAAVKAAVAEAQEQGIRYFLVVANMMTTMFGSVDRAEAYTEVLLEQELPFKLHIDGAYGGFCFPFAEVPHRLDFSNPHVTSITLDAHKMVQAPYGTGLFLARKGWVPYACTESAQYVQGLDVTLSGSRSGANAVSVWMILMTYGPHGWFEKIHILNYRTHWLCQRLSRLGLAYYRHAGSNIVAIRASQMDRAVAERFALVPDNHERPHWYKVVVMDHVTVDVLDVFVRALRQ